MGGIFFSFFFSLWRSFKNEECLGDLEIRRIRGDSPNGLSSGAGFHEAYIYVHDKNVRQLKIIYAHIRGRKKRENSDVVGTRRRGFNSSVLF